MLFCSVQTRRQCSFDAYGDKTQKTSTLQRHSDCLIAWLKFCVPVVCRICVELLKQIVFQEELSILQATLMSRCHNLINIMPWESHILCGYYLFTTKGMLRCTNLWAMGSLNFHCPYRRVTSVVWMRPVKVIYNYSHLKLWGFAGNPG